MEDDEGGKDRVAVDSLLTTPHAIDLLMRIHQQLVDLPARMDRRSPEERSDLLRQNHDLGSLTARSAALEERIRLSEDRAVSAESRVERLIERFFDFAGRILDRPLPAATVAVAAVPPSPSTAGLRLRQVGVNIIPGLMLGLATVLIDHALFPEGPRPLAPAALIVNAISLITLAVVFSYFLTPRAGE